MNTIQILDKLERIGCRRGAFNEYNNSFVDSIIVDALLEVGGEDDPTGVSHAALEVYVDWRDEGVDPVSCCGAVAHWLLDGNYLVGDPGWEGDPRDAQEVIDALDNLGVFDADRTSVPPVQTVLGTVTGIPTHQIAARIQKDFAVMEAT